ncbi:glycine zipper family protein [Cerasicoccus frondis]|uniref:glycine zipper family protein n=1 Tax=Cerasicoccus frondis TaxID=490090 RepID=UPI002852A443|nr:glycine zipper family protein [Cerasicoccus frondis]
MKAPLCFSLLLTGLTASLPMLNADTLELRNGSTLQGAYEGGTPDVVRFYFNGSSQEYNRGDIASLTFSKEAPGRPIEAASASTVAESAAAPATSAVAEIPAGATLVASLQTSINSGSVKAGSSFPAILVSDLRIGNEVVLPAGTTLQGQVVSAQSAGRFRKGADLTLTIDAINYQGQLIAVRTSPQQETQQGHGGRDILGGAAKGAALGAIVGAIDGDAGDAAAAGAAAGSASGLLRKGDNVEYQSGSVLAFTLESSVRL